MFSQLPQGDALGYPILARWAAGTLIILVYEEAQGTHSLGFMAMSVNNEIPRMELGSTG